MWKTFVALQAFVLYTLCVLPDMSGAIPNHLLFFQRESFNDTFAVIYKLAAQGFLHRSHYAYNVQQIAIISNITKVTINKFN